MNSIEHKFYVNEKRALKKKNAKKHARELRTKKKIIQFNEYEEYRIASGIKTKKEKEADKLHARLIEKNKWNQMDDDCYYVQIGSEWYWI
jgi:ABC-type lipoprotein release transport system permease subunit